MKTTRRPGRSIRTRAIVTQVILVVIPVVLCTLLLFRQIASDSAVNSAQVTYQYDRYIADTLDTACRQMESMANTIAGNRLVREYIAMEAGEARDQLFHNSVEGLLKYSYNRYLPTHNIEVIPGASLADVQTTPASARYFRSEFRMWSFDLSEGIPDCCFYYQFLGDDGTPSLLVFKPTPSMLTDTVERIASINKQSCALLGSDGKPLYLPETENRDLQAILDSASPDITEGFQILKTRGIYYCVRCEALPVMFVTVQPLSSVFISSDRMLPALLGCLLLIVFCSVISYRVFFNGITKRIISLSEACESLPIDRIGTADPLSASHPEAASLPAVQAAGSDEIGMLADSINDMIQRISELSIQNAQAVRASQRTAYDMLAAQIHPHFIYNTLENLRMMAEINDDPQVADQLYALGRMLRLSISDASSTGSVSMEIEHAQMYLQLQKLRLNDQLQYEIGAVPQEILDMKCPRFLLQPLVENALKHGFQQKKTPGRIQITSGRYEKGIWLRVFNDGDVIAPERLEEIREALKRSQPIEHTKGGIGLVNVNTRLKLFYGSEAGLTIESDREHGTACTLWLVTDGPSTPPGTLRA